MDWVQKSGLTYLQFPSLRLLEGVSHGVFLRVSNKLSSKSKAEYRAGFNLGLNCGDSDATVWHRRRVANSVMGDSNHMVFAHQVHGVDIVQWQGRQSDTLDGEPDRRYTYADGDALISDQPGQSLFIQIADCQPVILVDAVKKVIANVHSGWRGSVRNILGRTAKLMQSNFGCRGGDIHAGIGPSLGPCCAEFIHYREEIPSAYWPYRLSGNRFDFWRISMDQLITAGLSGGNIEISRMCTRCNPHIFYSYRAQKHTGRFAAAVALNNDSKERQ